MNEFVKLCKAYFIVSANAIEDTLASNVRLLDLLEGHVSRVVDKHDQLYRLQIEFR